MAWLSTEILVINIFSRVVITVDAMKAFNDAHILWKLTLTLATQLSGMTKYKNTSDQYFLQGSYHCRDAMKAYNYGHICESKV